MRDRELTIRVTDLSIRYKSMKAFSVKRNFFSLKHNKKEEFEAVKQVTFEVFKGEILGIIGKNGSGKSTLLKSLAGIFSPDNGTIEIFDNTISLLAIGVGFQKELSGRENIILSSMLLGFDDDFINEKMNEIIEFSELGDFIDKPVKTYSSGMYSKLAFSITAALDTSIILIDEVLSVGDQRFKQKSMKRMKELINDVNRTVVIVSHNLDTLRSLCDRILWIHDGEIKMLGDTELVLSEYISFMNL